MKHIWMGLMSLVMFVPAAGAVTMAQDIATTIILRGHECGGRTVSNIDEREDGQGNKTIRATCPNGMRYQIDVTASGRVSVRRVN